jgi:hypothetical protein
LPFTQIPTGLMNPIFIATVEATEEAIVNAMVGAETMTGSNGYRLYGLPHDELEAILGEYGRSVNGRCLSVSSRGVSRCHDPRRNRRGDRSKSRFILNRQRPF